MCFLKEISSISPPSNDKEPTILSFSILILGELFKESSLEIKLILEDSLMLQKEAQNTLNNLNQSLQQKTAMLADSLNGMHLNDKIFQNNLNKAMKQLSKSLDAYYSGDYLTALSEVDKALEIYPELAISYARKGSVYYKMQDIKRATINWNIALKLDPEYVEVRNILIAIKNRDVELKQLPE